MGNNSNTGKNKEPILQKYQLQINSSNKQISSEIFNIQNRASTLQRPRKIASFKSSEAKYNLQFEIFAGEILESIDFTSQMCLQNIDFNSDFTLTSLPIQTVMLSTANYYTGKSEDTQKQLLQIKNYTKNLMTSEIYYKQQLIQTDQTKNYLRVSINQINNQQNSQIKKSFNDKQQPKVQVQPIFLYQKKEFQEIKKESQEIKNNNNNDILFSFNNNPPKVKQANINNNQFMQVNSIVQNVIPSIKNQNVYNIHEENDQNQFFEINQELNFTLTPNNNMQSKIKQQNQTTVNNFNQYCEEQNRQSENKPKQSFKTLFKEEIQIQNQKTNQQKKSIFDLNLQPNIEINYLMESMLYIEQMKKDNIKYNYKDTQNDQKKHQQNQSQQNVESFENNQQVLQKKIQQYQNELQKKNNNKQYQKYHTEQQEESKDIISCKESIIKDIPQMEKQELHPQSFSNKQNNESYSDNEYNEYEDYKYPKQMHDNIKYNMNQLQPNQQKNIKNQEIYINEQKKQEAKKKFVDKKNMTIKTNNYNKQQITVIPNTARNYTNPKPKNNIILNNRKLSQNKSRSRIEDEDQSNQSGRRPSQKKQKSRQISQFDDDERIAKNPYKNKIISQKKVIQLMPQLRLDKVKQKTNDSGRNSGRSQKSQKSTRQQDERQMTDYYNRSKSKDKNQNNYATNTKKTNKPNTNKSNLSQRNQYNDESPDIVHLNLDLENQKSQKKINKKQFNNSNHNQKYDTNNTLDLSKGDYSRSNHENSINSNVFSEKNVNQQKIRKNKEQDNSKPYLIKMKLEDILNESMSSEEQQIYQQPNQIKTTTNLKVHNVHNQQYIQQKKTNKFDNNVVQNKIQYKKY